MSKVTTVVDSPGQPEDESSVPQHFAFIEYQCSEIFKKIEAIETRQALDYEEIRKIVREEISKVPQAEENKFAFYPPLPPTGIKSSEELQPWQKKDILLEYPKLTLKDKGKEKANE